MEQKLVEVWSTQRLPFPSKNENKDEKRWLKELRRDISNGVRDLERNQNAVLHAVYGAPLSGIRARDFCDTENILFYNVGCGSFAHIAQHGICFERSFSYPEPDVFQLLGDNLHYYRYAMMDENAGFVHWQDGRKLAEWNNVEIIRVASDMSRS
ncbi:MAG TPA: hypothetical protein DHW02_05095 [Ktedonobacter sp.]|nr:hypothetical protein [Ktedonobacter sp.]